MALELVVRTEWFGHVRGQVISDPADVAAVLASENAGKVQRIHAADPAPAPQPQPLTLAEAVARGVADAEAALHPSV